MRLTTESEIRAFVMSWQRARALSEVVARYGPGASSRASKLRAQGVQLKKFPKGKRRHPRAVDVRGLNQLIDSMYAILPSVPPNAGGGVSMH